MALRGRHSAVGRWARGVVATLGESRDDLELWRHKGGDVFRRLRADGSEADEVRFERDKTGHVNRFTEYSNPHDRLL